MGDLTEARDIIAAWIFWGLKPLHHVRGGARGVQADLKEADLKTIIK